MTRFMCFVFMFEFECVCVCMGMAVISCVAIASAFEEYDVWCGMYILIRGSGGRGVYCGVSIINLPEIVGAGGGEGRKGDR